MALYHSPSIVRSGLYTYLDAGNTKSYSGSGTTWADLSTTKQNATLVNSPVFSNGYFSFNGSNQRVDCGTNFSSIITGTNNFAIECWAYLETTQAQYANIWGNHTDNYTGIVLQQDSNTLGRFAVAFGNGSSWNGTSYFNLTTSNWNHHVFVRNGSSLLNYVNGTLANTTTNSASISSNSSFNFQIGTGYNLGASRYFNGRVSNFKLYNRALSATEIQQNFNALRGRYGV